MVKINRVINFSQQQFLFAKTNEDRTTSRKALYTHIIVEFLDEPLIPKVVISHVHVPVVEQAFDARLVDECVYVRHITVLATIEFIDLYTRKYFRNLIKSNQNQVVFTLFNLKSI